MKTAISLKPKYLSYANVTNEIPIHDFLFNDNILITLHLLVLMITMDPSSKTRAGSLQSFIKVICLYINSCRDLEIIIYQFVKYSRANEPIFFNVLVRQA